VLLQADRRVPYEHVMGAMVLLQRSGATQIGFLADPAFNEAQPPP
jgi:biopolymer transport protein ExbD